MKKQKKCFMGERESVCRAMGCDGFYLGREFCVQAVLGDVFCCFFWEICKLQEILGDAR